jgi:hypothetical protein
VAGDFESTVTFDDDWGTSNDSRTAVGDDAFITKINADGSYGWTRTFGGSGTDGALAVAVDGNSNVYVGGGFVGTADFRADWGGTADNKTAVHASGNGFVTKINADGSYGWTRIYGGSSWTAIQALAADGSGNAYAVGYYQATLDFAADFGSADPKLCFGPDDAFLTRIDADGSYGWTRRVGGTGQDRGHAVAVDGSGNVALAGSMWGTVNFELDWGGTDQRVSLGSSDAFVTLVLADGSYGWTYRFGGTGTEEALDLAFDGNQNLYVAGRFASTVNFALEWGGSDSKTPVNASDAFLTKVR